MEEFENQAIEVTETHEEKTLEELGLPNEMWAKIIELAYFEPNNFLNLEIFDEAKDIFEAIDIIDKYISEHHIAIEYVCKVFRALTPKISKEQWIEFKQKIRKFYTPYLNEKFLEWHEAKEGSYPKGEEWYEICSESNQNIAKFMETGILSDTELFADLAAYISNSKTHFNLIHLLLFYGIDPNIKNKKDKTALYCAIEKHTQYTSNRDKIELLLQYGANPNIKNSGKAPLCLAISRHNPLAETNNISIIELLFKYKANPNIRENDGKTPLHGIPRVLGPSKDFTIINLLFQHNANPNIADDDGFIPLHIPYRYQKDMIIHLLELGYNPYIKAKNGTTSFDNASKNQFTEFTQLVRQHAQNTLKKICVLHILNNLSLYEGKLDILPVELRDRINNLRSN